MNYKNDNKILLILDVDETLIHATEQELDRVADFKVFHYNIYKRPYLEDFLREVSEDFILAIWSSASDDYVEAVVKKIVPPEIPLVFIWARSRCTYRRNIQINEYGYYEADFDNHYHYIKPLKKLKRKGYHLNRILIVDDTPHKSKDNYGNAIYPSEFKGNINDEELRVLSKYLRKLKDNENIRNIEKRNWRNQVDD